MLDALAPYIGMAILVAFMLFARYMADDGETKSPKTSKKDIKQ